MRTVIIITAVAMASLNCGEPAEPVSFLWEKKTEIQKEYYDFIVVGVGPRGLYAIGRMGRPAINRLVAYDGSSFAVDFEAPAGSGIYDVAFWGDSGFMSVTEESGGRKKAYLYKLENGVWVVAAYYPDGYYLTDLTPVGTDECWLRSWGDLIKYERGTIAKYPGIDFAVDRIAYNPNTKILLAVEKFGGLRLCLTADDGVTWYRENVSVPGFNVNGFASAAAAGNSFYSVTDTRIGDISYNAVVKRTGTPGEGIYELSYLGWNAPGYIGLAGAAFRNENEGVAVGTAGCITFDGRGWTREIVPPDYGFDYINLVSDPRGGYWCTTTDDESGRSDLVWHP